MSRKVLSILMFCAALAAAAPPALAQTTTGAITGVVRDPDGGVIPGVEVRARHEGTNAEHAAVSNDQGVYILRGLSVGRYTVTAQLTGFQSFEHPGVLVRVNEEVRLDVPLAVGDVSETVTIAGRATAVDTTTSTLRTVVDQQRIESLPLNGRNPTQLMLLVPGVQPDTQTSLTSGNTYPGVTPVSSSGAPGNATNYVLDGGSNNDHYNNAPNPMPNPDALQEFSVQTNNFNAEYGRNIGAIVNAVTRSGTNDYNGAAFGYLRHHSLNATNFFTPGEDDGLKRGQFGATLGGPIVRNRTFFFGSYQGTMERVEPTSQSAIVPTEAQRRGDFSALDGQLHNPFTGGIYPNNQIPPEHFSPAAVAILSDWLPLPNEPDNRLSYAVPSQLDDHQWLARVDHRLSDQHSLYGRFWYSRAHVPPHLEPGNILAGSSGNTWPNTIVSLNDTYVISNNLLNNLVVTFNRTNSNQVQDYPPDYSTLGITNVYNDDLPQWVFNVSGYFNINTGDTNEFLRNEIQIVDTLRWSTGRHEISTGIDYAYGQGDIVNNFRANGRYTFSGGAPFTGDALADFLVGQFSQFEQGLGQYKRSRLHALALFVQDNFRVNDRLSLNLGLRWDPFFPYTDADNHLGCYRPGIQSSVYVNAPEGAVYPGDPGCPSGGYDKAWLNFGPRLGVAYDPFGDGLSSIRAGYGIFYDRPNTILTNDPASGQAPFGTVVRIPGDSRNNVSDPFVGRVNPFPADPFDVPQDAAFILPHNAVSYDEGYENATLHSWHLTVEREVWPTWLVRVAYAGSRGTRLPMERELNAAVFEPGATTATTDERRPLYPTFGNIRSREATGRSSYHSLQVTLDKRFSNGLSILTNYTLSKTLDHSSAAKEGGSQTNPFDLDFDWGPANFDRRHRFVTSWLWEIPGRVGGGLAEAALGGWSLTGILTLESGLPFTVTSDVDNARSGTGDQRADLIGDPALPGGRSTEEKIAEWFNTAAFAPNALGTFGNVGRNSLRGPGSTRLDLGLQKSFDLTDGVRAQFRLEAFNALNNVNFDLPDSTQSSGNFGMILEAADPRILQLAFRVSY